MTPIQIADSTAIDAEAEAIADEFHRLMSTSTYKGKNIFVTTAGGEYVSMGGRDAEMTFGLGKVAYQEMYIHNDDGDNSLTDWNTETGLTGATVRPAAGGVATGGLITDVVMKGIDYVVTTGLDGNDAASFAADDAAADVNAAADTFTATSSGVMATGRVTKAVGQLRYTASEGMYTVDDGIGGTGDPQTNLLTTVVQNVQAKINTARVQAGSQYAALESAVNYTTDLTAQYELGYNTVNDVNFSMETAHLAKNQILQQAATAMLAQANQGQQGLLQLIS